MSVIFFCGERKEKWKVAGGELQFLEPLISSSVSPSDKLKGLGLEGEIFFGTGRLLL